MPLSNKNPGRDNRRKKKREVQIGTYFFVSESSYMNLSYYEKQEKILHTIPFWKYGNPATLVVWRFQNAE